MTGQLILFVLINTIALAWRVGVTLAWLGIAWHVAKSIRRYIETPARKVGR